ncbi:MAG: hypothetical protein ACTSRG_18310 [Candidatus Helarchaeota archaeon]
MNNSKNEPELAPKYTTVCKKCSKLKYLRELCIRMNNKKLSIAAQHLFNKYKLYPHEIFCTALIFLSLSMIISLIFSLIMKNLFFFLMGTILGILFYYSIINKLVNEYENEKLLILKYLEIMFHEFLIILLTSKSIFDSILFISKGNYPIISKKFQEMIFQINFGSNPENLLHEFALNQPSRPFRDRILTLLATNFSFDIVVEELEKNIIEKETEYQKYTKELDSKLVLILGICTFIPLLLTILILLNGLENNYIIFIFPIFFWFLVNYLKRNLLKTNFLIFGSNENEKINNYKKNKKKISDNRSEFEELIEFLLFFGNFLKRGLTLERALINSISKYKGFLKVKLNKIRNKILFKNLSFQSAWDDFSNDFSNPQVIQILSLIKRMLTKDSIKTGDEIILIVNQLKKNQNLIKKREIIYKSQHFKIRIISIISGFILGLLMSLAPILGLAFSLTSLNIKFQNLLLKMINYIEFLPLIITLISILIVSSYNLAKIIQLNNPIQNILITLLTFGVTWYFCYTYVISLI